MIEWLLPWEFSPTISVCCWLAVVLYARGRRGERASGSCISAWRPFAFYLGIALVYAVMQTHLDYLAQHMFWIHRLQHLILHHIAPVLIALAAPWSAIARALPASWSARPGAPLVRIAKALYAVVQQPLIALVLFTGLIYFWLTPAIHFRAMLGATEYEWMNASMVVDGILFWWLMLDPRSRQEGARMGFGARIPIVLLAMLPQMMLGAYLSLHNGVLYDVYAVCGRLWPIDPTTDQQIGGLITWIPASMMSVLVALVMWHRWMANDDRVRRSRAAASATTPPRAPAVAEGAS